MSSGKGGLHFWLMTLSFMVRDLLFPPEKILREAGVKPGFCVLDFGCGPGSYTLAASHLVGEKGLVYALDMNPLAIRRVKRIASNRKLANIRTILSDCETGLPDESVDLILLYDTYHELKEPRRVLAELHRVLKPEGFLSFSDHHLSESRMVTELTDIGFFRFVRKGKKTCTFTKASG